MRRTTSRIALVVAVVLGLAVIAVLGLGTPKPSEAAEPCNGYWTSTGCSFYYDYEPTFGGCFFWPGHACYYCEYTCVEGNFEQCGENQDGSTQLCTGCDGMCRPFYDY